MLLTFATTFGRISPCRLIDSVDNRTSRNRCTTPVSCFAHTASNSRHGTYERVLRYPDGHERRIRYPAPVLDEESVDVHGETWESLNYWTALATKKRRPESSKAAGSEVAEDKDLRVDSDLIPDSPLQLLRYMTSEKYNRTQKELWKQVQGSYQVLEGSPWVAPRPLYVLATQQADREEGLTYTLRTRVDRQDMEDELTRVLGRRRPDGSAVIRCSEIRDGVIAFEDEEVAGRYADLLESGATHGEVSVARCESHALFRSVQNAKSVVVLLRPTPQQDGSLMPQPHHLAAVLRGQQSMEDDTGSGGVRDRL